MAVSIINGTFIFHDKYLSCILISALQTLFIRGLAAEAARANSRRKSRRINNSRLYKIGKPYVKKLKKNFG